MADRDVFSREGYDYYNKKLATLRREVASSGEAVGEAAGENHDWHDNFGYEDSLRTLERVSIRATDLQRSLARAQVIDIIEQSTRVAIGNTVEIKFDDNKEIREITIGAWGESDPTNGLISYRAPLARAVIGKTEDDEGKFSRTKGEDRSFITNRIHPASYKYRELIRALFAK